MIQSETAGGENVFFAILVHFEVANLMIKSNRISVQKIAMMINGLIEVVEDGVDGVGFALVDVAKHHKLAAFPGMVDVLVLLGNRRSSILGFQRSILGRGRRDKRVVTVRRIRDKVMGRIRRRVSEIN